MEYIRKAMDDLRESQSGNRVARTLTFEEFLLQLRRHPARNIRNVHQVFHDMVRSFVGDGFDEYPEDPESIHFVNYDFNRLFVEDTDNPFFADRIFANRLMNMIDGLRGSAQQNKIYIFDGPPGCGKSIFLNNLLQRFEEYANSPEGMRYETVWRLDPKILGIRPTKSPRQDYVEVPCPSHDNPILMIPKDQRPDFFDTLFESDEFKWNLNHRLQSG